MKKIIYICYLPLTIKLEQDFYIDEVVDNGFPVEYWDISGISFKTTLADSIEREYILKINSIEELENKIKQENIPETYFIMMITYEWRVFNLYRLFSMHDCFMLFFSRGLLPIYYNPVIKSLVTKLQQIYNLKMIYAFLRDLIFNKLAVMARQKGLIKNYDIVFAAGNVAIKSYTFSPRIIECNQLDYDNYLATKDCPQKIIEGKYCVFLDEYLPYHPDFAISKTKTVKPAEYFRAMNTLFDHIEKTLNIRVVIAAHPKSDYQENVFDGRAVYKYKTNELVKDCAFAIAHVSTSISYAVLYKKPLLFVYTDGISRANERYVEYIKRFAKTTGNSACNIEALMRDNFRELNSYNDIQKAVDTDKYNDYKYNYLTSPGCENIQTKDIFLNLLKQSN